MAKKEKIYKQVKDNPKGWRFKKLSRLLERYGFNYRSGKGSHFVFDHPVAGTRLVLVNHPGDLHPNYARDVVKAIDEVIAYQESRHDQG